MALKFNPLTGAFDVVKDQADEIAYDNTTSGLAATDVQAALDEVDGDLDGHLDGGASKHDATEIDYERADGSKKNIQASSDDIESATTDLDDAIGSLAASPTNYTPASSTIVASHLSGIDSALGSITSTVNNFEWQESVIDKDLTAPPGSPSTGDRYLIGLDTAASVATGAWATHDGEVAEYNGTSWDFITPTTGMFVGADDETDRLYLFGGTTWTARYFEATTASGFLSKSGFDIQLTNLSDGNVIVGNGSNVATSVNTASVGDIDADTTAGLTIKSGIIDNDNINASAAIDASKIADGSVSNTEFQYLDGVTSDIQTQLDGKVDGPASATDNAIARYDLGTGKLIQNSGVLIDDTNNLSGIGNITLSGTVDGRDVAADGSTLDGHLDGGASKHDATEIDYERADGSKKNIDAASDDVELALTDLDDAIGVLAASPTNYTPTDATITADHLSAIDTELGNKQPFMTNSSLAGDTTAANNTRYLVDTTAVRTITLPAASDNFIFEVKDISGQADTNNIVIARAGSESIEGAASNYTINSEYSNTRFVSDGVNWWVV